MAQDSNYNKIEEAIKFLAGNFKHQPSLEEIAGHVNISSYHFQRIFSERVGISPKKFLQYLTVKELKKELKKTQNIIEAAEKVGLSAQSRVYDLFVNIEAVTPNEFKTKGKGIEIQYGIHETPFGNCLIGVTERGICLINFILGNEDRSINELHTKWQNAFITPNSKSTKKYAEMIFDVSSRRDIKLLVRGTKFQIKVWEALLKIPFGTVASYQTIANIIHNPKAVRAVGTAIGNNPIAFIIPCHRVIRSEGLIGQYSWESIRKSAIIGWEKSQLEVNTLSV
jgi:AraC family transcriptional regulator of adaptative response/methylated-DNA-[protein]-cysteine methyltransferase